MAGLAGFTDNPFASRSDLLRAALALIKPLEPYQSATRARVKIRPSTVAAFDDVAAQLEGFSRPLWGIGAILANPSSDDSGLEFWLRGLVAGVDSENPDFWGDVGPFDQRMVEMEAIAFALLAAPTITVSMLTETSKKNLENWLIQINHHAMPQNNWRWFRILVNLALSKVLGTPESELKQRTDEDFAILDQFYLGEGWSSDGMWGDDRKQADYYPGSFSIQFAQLLYVCFAEGDEERVQRYRTQAQAFSATFWRYFAVDGAAIPYGRSLTYRFAFAAFWAVAALANIQLPAPMDSPGAIKGMLLRHLRWWAHHPDIFNSDGTLNVGFTYPNMYLSEDYNSSQSVYWCLKSFVVLCLPEGHEFWTCQEKPHPMSAPRLEKPLESQSFDLVQVNWPPRHILCNSPEHHFLLSSGQMTTKSFKAREAKYGKLAYSSAFAFSVPTGSELHQMAPDSTLSITLDGGDTWKVRWRPFNVRIESIDLDIGHGVQQKLPSLVSVWKPESLSTMPGCKGAQLVDASFAIPAFTSAGHHLPELPGSPFDDACDACYNDNSRILIKSRAGTTGIVDLTPGMVDPTADPTSNSISQTDTESFIIKADPNTSLVSQRTFIPALRSHLRATSDHKRSEAGVETKVSSIIVASGVFATSNPHLQNQESLRMWSKRPKVRVRFGSSKEPGSEIFRESS
ncbi:hypothetical protein QQX98_003425 [Neonectria punicea]|uniref:DUF2264 domain-containing protein n=1 Tax=Neonectria punicea TaxID=979145 RepID=A0ABR1HDM9_9HYPO